MNIVYDNDLFVNLNWLLIKIKMSVFVYDLKWYCIWVVIFVIELSDVKLMID